MSLRESSIVDTETGRSLGACLQKANATTLASITFARRPPLSVCVAICFLIEGLDQQAASLPVLRSSCPFGTNEVLKHWLCMVCWNGQGTGWPVTCTMHITAAGRKTAATPCLLSTNTLDWWCVRGGGGGWTFQYHVPWGVHVLSLSNSRTCRTYSIITNLH